MDYQSFNGGRPSIRIRILVVDDDYMSLNLAATTLRSLQYEVLTAKHPFEALSTLHMMKGGIDLVVSDYHMPDMNGVQLQKRILEEFKIPVIMMSVDSRKFIMVECLQGGSKVFVVKPIQVEKFENVWQFVVANNKGKSPWTAVDSMDRVDSYIRFQDPRPVSFSFSCNKQIDQDGKNKNHKVVWTNGLHTLFLQAMRQLGLEKAVPKKILDIMKVPGLTRQHVASHLQKYRIFLKKVADRAPAKWNDPQKALNDAFELSIASNAQYHDMVLSMPPSQFARSQDSKSKFGSSSSVISFGNDQYGANSSSSYPFSTLGRATWNAPNSNAFQNANASPFPSRECFSNNTGGGFQGFGSDSRNMFQSQQFGSSAKNLNPASWNGNPNNSCNIQNGLRIHGKENQFPARPGLNSMSPNPNNRSFDSQIVHGMPAKEYAFPTAPGLRSISANPNNINFRMLENEPNRQGLNSMSPNPNNSSFRVLENEQTSLWLNPMNPNPNNNSFRVLENEPTRQGLNSMSPIPNNSSFRVLENEPTRQGLNSMSPNPNNSSFRVLQNEPTRQGLNSMSPNPNNSSFRVLENEPTRQGLNSMSPNPNNGSFRVLENEPTRQGLNSMSSNPNNNSFRVLENEPASQGLNSMSSNPNNNSFRVLENEPAGLGLNSMSPNPNNTLSSNHTGITMGGNEHLIPSRLGLSGSYKPDNGFDIRVDSTKGALVFENNNWMNQIEPNAPGHCYINQHGEPSSFNTNVLNSTPTVTNNLQENCASNDIEVSPYVLDDLETTVLPPAADMSQKPTLGDDGFDCFYDLDLSELLSPQGNADIDMAMEYAALPPLDESEDQNWDDDFISSLLVDDGPYMGADELSSCLP